MVFNCYRLSRLHTPQQKPEGMNAKFKAHLSTQHFVCENELEWFVDRVPRSYKRTVQRSFGRTAYGRIYWSRNAVPSGPLVTRWRDQRTVQIFEYSCIADGTSTINN